jgi:hypothetical protein
VRDIFWPFAGAVAGVLLLLLVALIFGLAALAGRKNQPDSAARLAQTTSNPAPSASPSPSEGTRSSRPEEVADARHPLPRRPAEDPRLKWPDVPRRPLPPPKDPGARRRLDPPATPPVKVVLSEEEELRKQLREVPELDLYPAVDRLRGEIDNNVEMNLKAADLNTPEGKKLQRSILTGGWLSFSSNVNVPVLEEAIRQGLPVQVAGACKADRADAQAMQEVSTALRTNQFVSLPGLPMAAQAVPKFVQWLKDHPANDLGARRILVQMLQVENEQERRMLIGELARALDETSLAALARLAVFDSSADIRNAALEVLKNRNLDLPRALFLNTLRYPWAPAARRAALALVTLEDRKAIPSLVGLLDLPDPARPVFDESRRKPVVRELVRINHMRNCYLCHPAGPVLHVPVGGVVPRPGKPIPALYYAAQSSENVRADITFVRQDFSVCQPVPDHGLWPERQRFDYLTRVREATPAEATALAQPAPESYPQRDSVLFALRRLTGKDLGTTSKDWLAVLDGQKPEPLPPVPDRQAAPAPTGERLLIDLAALGVGPRARPHLTSTSPEGKWMVSVAPGNQVVVSPREGAGPVMLLHTHNYPITSVWWTLDRKNICIDDDQGVETVFNVATGKQEMAFQRATTKP